MVERDANSIGSQEGYELMAAAFEVHNTLGGGLREHLYQESLEIELSMRNIPFRSKPHYDVHYKGHQLASPFIPDVVVHELIIVELKSVRAIGDDHLAHLLNYMRIARQPVGYLINFGPTGRLEWRRCVCSEYL